MVKQIYTGKNSAIWNNKQIYVLLECGTKYLSGVYGW